MQADMREGARAGRRRRRRVVRVALCALSALGAAVGLWCLLRPPHLLERATRVAFVSGWPQDISGWSQDLVAYSTYVWQSPHQVVWLRNTPPNSFQAVRTETTTGRETVLTHFDRWFTNNANRNVSWRPSPDGKWVAMSLANPTCSAVVALDKERTTQFWWLMTNGGGTSFWMPDSQRWVSFETVALRVHCTLHSLDGSDRSGSDITEQFPWPLGIDAGGRVLSADSSTEGRLTLDAYALELKSAPSYRSTFPLPRDACCLEIEPSPSGNRLAYLFSFHSHPIAIPLLGQFLARLNKSDVYKTALWVSRVDGSGMREIGYETSKRLAGVQWTPDGKRVSFLCDNTIYTVPAD